MKFFFLDLMTEEKINLEVKTFLKWLYENCLNKLLSPFFFVLVKFWRSNFKENKELQMSKIL